MAKGQVTEEELATGLKGIGNFGALSSPRVRRDNPFRDSRAEEVAAEPEVIKTVDVAPVPAAAPVADGSTGKLREPELKSVDVKRKSIRTVEPVLNAPKQERGRRLKSEEGSRKADVFTERVTLQMRPEMRDEIDSLARDLQRAKTSREERITANTVMRVALQLLITNYQFVRSDVANTEEELYALIADRLKLK